MIVNILSFAVFVSFVLNVLQCAYHSIFFIEKATKIKNIFDDITISNTPPTKEAIETKVNQLKEACYHYNRSMFFNIFSLALGAIILFFIPSKHVLSNSPTTLFVILICSAFLLLIKVFNGIHETVVNKNNSLSFVEYGSINDSEIKLIRSVDDSREYLKNVALSGRKITKYEIKILEEFAETSKEKERDEAVISTIIM